MKDVIIYIADPETDEQARIIFSSQELTAINIEADEYPVSPLLVKRIEEASRNNGFMLAVDQSQLYRIAKEMIVEGERQFRIAGYRLDSHASNDGNFAEVESRLKPRTGQIFCRRYTNPLSGLDVLKSEIKTEGMIPILWNNTGGFDTRQLSRQFPLFNDVNPASLRDPRQAFRFIIDQPQSRIGYIFEDIHHFIGSKEGVGPAIGEIRSLIKELYRSLEGRNERVYFFVPESYDLPPDIEIFLGDSRDKGDSKAKLPLLERFGRRMSGSDSIRNLKPVIGAEPMIERIIQTLCQMESNNPLLVGQPGVGKTALVEGFGVVLSENRVPSALRGRTLYSLALSGLIAGTRYRGELESRLEKLMAEVLCHKDEIVLFIDEIHGLLDAGLAEGGFGIGDVLKPVLARGEFPLIGATTFSGMDHLSKDAALRRRFREIVVNEPTMAQTLAILQGIRGNLERHHAVRIDDSALRAAVKLSERYRRDEFRPGKVIALVDSAAAFCGMKGASTVLEIDIIREINR